MVETGQEQAWIEQSRQGDETAFEDLIRMHQRMVHGMAFRMTGCLEDADDLAQETFAQAFRQLGSFRGDAKFSSWLCRVTINTCLNWRRREARREATQRRWAEEWMAERRANSRDGLSDDLSRRIQAALDHLAPEQRAAIVLTVYQEMNHAEAARALECAETTISWRLFMARRKLKQWLKADLAKEAANV